jgi:hypothetical protein
LDEINWDLEANDSWSFSWGTADYSNKRAYNNLIGDEPASPLFTWLWGSGNLGKHKFFLWLLLHDRLNTRNLLRRKNMHLDDYTCVLCNLGHEETSLHLFFDCPFSVSCWNTIPISWNRNLSPLDMVIETRTNFGRAFFREIFITARWIIWTTRNSVIFDNGQVNTVDWKHRFREELGLVCIKAKKRIQEPLSLWRESYVV